ncbi:UDP-glycosyltransferase 79B30 [Frankliniella fusca]|uniref:UDP-glycosyltransferase 79B30 n=1 Tax=Frankliniella fusca TaxID=407009 RepID=A0AAE1HD51_9NEOP|nr:UDP-glycosyltransferase 79B30 [Frankliniella fusca]
MPESMTQRRSHASTRTLNTDTILCGSSPSFRAFFSLSLMSVLASRLGWAAAAAMKVQSRKAHYTTTASNAHHGILTLTPSTPPPPSGESGLYLEKKQTVKIESLARVGRVFHAAAVCGCEREKCHAVSPMENRSSQGGRGGPDQAKTRQAAASSSEHESPTPANNESACYDHPVYVVHTRLAQVRLLLRRRPWRWGQRADVLEQRPAEYEAIASPVSECALFSPHVI